MSVLELFLLEIFRNSFYCHLLFNYQCSLLSRDSSFRLSHLFAVVNSFFYFFEVLFLNSLLPQSATKMILTRLQSSVNTFFENFSKQFVQFSKQSKRAYILY